MHLHLHVCIYIRWFTVGDIWFNIVQGGKMNVLIQPARHKANFVLLKRKCRLVQVIHQCKIKLKRHFFLELVENFVWVKHTLITFWSSKNCLMSSTKNSVGGVIRSILDAERVTRFRVSIWSLNRITPTVVIV